jgi:hypothetical protein
MKNAVFCDVKHSMLRLLVIAVVVPSSLILFTLMMESILSSETLVFTRLTQCHIPFFNENLCFIYTNSLTNRLIPLLINANDFHLDIPTFDMGGIILCFADAYRCFR